MAAIVSKLAAANRQRKANRLKHISIDKCVYILPPFDPCFKPEIHNRYVRTKHSHLAHQEFMVKIGTVSPVHIHQLEKLGDQSLKNTRQQRSTQPSSEDINTENDSMTKCQDSPSQDDNSTSNNLKNTERHQQYKYTKKSSRNIEIKDEIIPEEIVTIDAQDESEDDIINDVEMKLMNDYSEDEDFVNSTISKEGSTSAKDSEEESLSTRSQIVIAVLVVLGFIPLFGIVIYLVGLFYNVPNTLGWTL